MKVRLALSFVVVPMLALPAVAQGFVDNFNVSPKHPYVDQQSIIIKWKTDHTLRSGYHYSGEVSVTDDTHYQCRGVGTGGGGSAFASSTRRSSKGSTMSLEFDSFSSQDLLGRRNEGYLEWCPGKATITIYEAKSGELIGKIVGIGTFRFYTKP